MIRFFRVYRCNCRSSILLLFACVFFFLNAVDAVDADQNGVPLEVIETLKEEAPEVIEQLVISKQKSEFWNSPITLGTVIFATTFIFEEAAIAASAFLISSNRLNDVWGFFCLYAGIFISDLFLYAIGVVIGRSRWLQGYFDIKYYRTRAINHVGKGFWTAIVVARLLPGMLIPIFIFLGMIKADFRKVACVNLVVTGIYSFLALYFLIILGVQISNYFDLGIGLAFGFLFLLFLHRSLLWNWFRVIFLIRNKNISRWHAHTHSEMPELLAPRRLTFFESLPEWIVYFPIFGLFVYLTIRHRSLSAICFVNPGLENSGLFGESKSKMMDNFPDSVRSLLPKYLVLEVKPELKFSNLPDILMSAGLEFPLVAKPDVGYMSRGVELMRNIKDVENYLEIFPEGQKLILQEFVSGLAEAGILYATKPSATTEPLITMALTYQPFVVGNGRKSVERLIADDPRFSFFNGQFNLTDPSHVPAMDEVVRLKVTGSTRDGAIHIRYDISNNSKLFKNIKVISESIPEFWLGRFDVKFTSLEALMRGEFVILELNGVAGEDLTAWDPRTSIFQTYKVLGRQLRLIYEIGLENKRRGFIAPPLHSMLKAFIMQESVLLRLVNVHKRDRQHLKT